MRYEDYEAFELMLRLSAAGWSRETKKSSKKQTPYKSGAAKVFFYTSGSCDTSGISKDYLRTLLLADFILSHLHQKQLWHFQPVMYYKAILFLYSHGRESEMHLVKPHQPHSFYKLLMQQSHNKKRKAESQMDFDHDAGSDIVASCRFNQDLIWF